MVFVFGLNYSMVYVVEFMYGVILVMLLFKLFRYIGIMFVLFKEIL